jgi:hypothetical protein
MGYGSMNKNNFDQREFKRVKKYECRNGEPPLYVWDCGDFLPAEFVVCVVMIEVAPTASSAATIGEWRI